MLLKLIVFNFFQLALLSHLHPAFEMLVSSELKSYCITIYSPDASIKTDSATCNLYLQFNCDLNYALIT